ncbi:hypothetical protein OnM2_034061 [Erysiphe neolycopersici]|uniref:Uncharacterized protein n=1 Tax=Erysiphe neolycopersici TaxID=212602 RepID=A0A420HY45_9PEZI|nr:hypothetical protein OnM2_034061 [Erysiphe neolycopersici]
MENVSDKNITISRHQKLGNFIDSDAQIMTVIDEIEVFHLAQSPPISATKRLFMKGLLATAATVTSTESMKSNVHNLQKTHETILTNGIMVFGDNQQTKQLQLLVQENAGLWIARKNLAKVAKGEEMTIDLCDDWKTKYKPGQAKVCSASNEDQALIDKTFDKLHEQKRLKWTTKSTPFSFPVFCIWKTVVGENN